MGSFNHCDSQANTPGALKRATLEVKMVHSPIIADDKVNLLTQKKILSQTFHFKAVHSVVKK